MAYCLTLKFNEIYMLRYQFAFREYQTRTLSHTTNHRTGAIVRSKLFWLVLSLRLLMDVHFDVVECQYGGRQTFHMLPPLAPGAVHSFQCRFFGWMLLEIFGGLTPGLTKKGRLKWCSAVLLRHLKHTK